MNERLKESVGKTIKIFLINNFHYEGKLTNLDETFLELLDFKTNSYKLIRVREIKEIEVRQ